MKKITRKQFLIVEIENTIEIEDSELERISNLEDDDRGEIIDDLFCDSQYKFYKSINDYTSDQCLELFDFEVPEYSEYLGQFDIIQDENEQFIVESDIYDVNYKDLNGVSRILINGDTLKTFYWDYSDIKRTDYKSYVRDQKINNILT